MESHALKHEPLDAYNLALTENLHPAAWINPEPARRYNMVVIGAGPAGLVIAAGAAILGAKVALVERDLMGGDCLNFGCVPSKALIRSARAAAAVRDAGRFGVEVPAGVRVNFQAVMERMRRLRAELSPTDSANRFRSLGVDVFIGDGRFTGPDCVEVDGRKLRFRKAAIATGARAAAIPIPGLAAAGYLTNETVFSLTELPRRIAVIGAGPIGCELAQTFARFGAQVTILEVAPQILIREDRDAAERVERAIVRDGVEIITGCRISGVELRGNEKIIATQRAGISREIIADEILIGVGRVPAVEGLNLEAAMIEYDRQNGVKVDDYLRTTNPIVYAAGDVASPYKFTHLADAHARIILRNALFFGLKRASRLTIPWCTYTDPEIAHVGLYEAEAKQRGITVATYTQELAEVDRAVLDGETDGFVKLHVRQGSDRIVGATVVASHAGEIISELTAAIAAGVGLGRLGDVIHPYPTQADAIRRAAGLYTRTRLTPLVAGLMKRWLALAR
ncbi:mercuric reductase [Candidatus Binatus sp.]|uniref:mercuric reductase n=1 Tax=Candidatus Binatus sp. TaxID=2811406 RepID=UPI002F92BA5C